jgi:hypothetical protein
MANTDAPHGLRPYSNSGVVSGSPRVRRYPLLATNSEIGLGTTVYKLTAGVNIWTSGPILGVAAEYKAANAGAATDDSRFIAVWDDPTQLFEGQCDNGTGTSTVETAIGLNTTIVGNSGVTNRRSTAELDESTATTTNTLPYKIMALAKYPDNAYGEFNRLVVRPNNHQLVGDAGSTGV